MVFRKLARPLLASAFITRGVDALQHPGTRIPAAQKFSESVAEPLGLPQDPELLVRVNGAVMAGAGALLALGKMPRLAGVALTLSLVPATLFEHRFWEESDAEVKAAEKKQFFGNLGLLGGVLLASLDTAGAPGLAWRTKNAAHVASLESQLAAKNAASALSDKLPF
ncbi:DoxX family membrane protein [Ornithinimicrobium cryptoxanthini]|uniref:DoxX family membrane protein n=1 Tax=Ornithinimicrobium cryptoxanthini TaxID=2934161 RepID=A0ABY4YK48_9MICO|nr:DoxX family membrane protein [Ornithinimicrobium cryptoxanthini]USQ77152.1 DoxX family membrane protein [Ornithinimicrobium cryptoxanthini]